MPIDKIASFSLQVNQFLALNENVESRAEQLDPAKDKVKLLATRTFGDYYIGLVLNTVDFTNERVSWKDMMRATNFSNAMWAIETEHKLLQGLETEARKFANQGLDEAQLETICETLETLIRRAKALDTCLKCVQNGYMSSKTGAPEGKLKHSGKELNEMKGKIKDFHNDLERLEGSLSLLRNDAYQSSLRAEKILDALGDDRERLMMGDRDFCKDFATNLFAKSRAHILNIDPEKERLNLMTTTEQGEADLHRATAIIGNNVYRLRNPRHTTEVKKQALLEFCGGDQELYNRLLSIVNQSKLSAITTGLATTFQPLMLTIGKPRGMDVDLLESRFSKTDNGLIRASYSSLYPVAPTTNPEEIVLWLKGSMEIVISEADLKAEDYSKVQFIPTLDVVDVAPPSSHPVS